MPSAADGGKHFGNGWEVVAIAVLLFGAVTSMHASHWRISLDDFKKKWITLDNLLNLGNHPCQVKKISYSTSFKNHLIRILFFGGGS